MRDPNRIPEILDLLRLVWEKYPDMRLCQLVIVSAEKNDPFFVEDDKIVDRLKQMLE